MKKDTQILLYAVIVIGAILMLANSCKKSDDDNPDPSIQNGTVTDIEGNVYKTVKIGTQWWMAENLKTTKFNDGTSIPNVIDNSEWENLRTPGYCWYNNDITNKNTYGALYNWYTISTAKLAPVGWHIPTEDEWGILVVYLYQHGYTFRYEDDIAKSMASTSGWNPCSTPGTIGNDQGTNNKSGFSALPASGRDDWGRFADLGGNATWWSSTYDGTYFESAWVCNLKCDDASIYNYLQYANEGLSIRLVKD